MKNKTWSARVWGGDPSTVAEARKAYEQEPEDAARLVKYAVALYSFRSKGRFAEELLVLRPWLLRRAWALLKMERPTESEQVRKFANEVDVLSTHLAWVSRQPQLASGVRREAHNIAVELCREGLEILWKRGMSGHSRLLIGLTRAELFLDDGEEWMARGELIDIEHEIREVQDAKQKVRIMRKLGTLWRRTGSHVRGTEWILRSIFVADVPLAVRLKSVAALFGINR